MGRTKKTKLVKRIRYHKGCYLDKVDRAGLSEGVIFGQRHKVREGAISVSEEKHFRLRGKY